MATVYREVRCSAQRVLDVLADGWTYGMWVVGAARIRGVDPGWPAPGTRLAHSVGMWPFLIQDVTVSRGWDPERSLDLVARGWPAGEAHIHMDVTSLGPDRCRVTMAEDATKGPGKLIPSPLRQLLIRPRNRETLRRLALLAERRPSDVPDAAVD